MRVANLDEKDIILSLDPAMFFTEPHYNGYPAVLVHLAASDGAELEPLIVHAGRCQAPKALVTASGFDGGSERLFGALRAM